MEIQKSTYVEADDKTRHELTFDLLLGLHVKVDELKECYKEHLPVCDRRFKKLEDRKKIDTMTSAGAGVVGGFLATIYQWWTK
jgi:hypothetical protein